MRVFGYLSKQIQISCKSYVQRLLREGSDFRRQLSELSEIERFGEERRKEFQLAALRKL